eukprot:375056_1
MSNPTDTSTEECEGNDKLKEFLVTHVNKLKKVENIYQKLHENEIDYNELMEYNEQDLRDTLNEIEMKKINSGRIINLLRVTHESRIYKEKNNTTIKVIVLSEEEQNALLSVEKHESKISEVTAVITNKIKTLDVNLKEYHQIINDNFAEIIQKANERKKQLLTDLNQRVNDNKSILLNQIDVFSRFQNELKQFHKQSEKLIHNDSM